MVNFFFSALKSPDSRKRKQILEAFYKQVVGHLWPPNPPSFKPVTVVTKDGGVVNGDEGDEGRGDLHQNLLHKMTDTYIVTDTHKCYALQEGARQMFVLYSNDIPTYAMRFVCGLYFYCTIKFLHIFIIASFLNLLTILRLFQQFLC